MRNRSVGWFRGKRERRHSRHHGDAVLVANADVAPLPGAVGKLAAFMASRTDVAASPARSSSSPTAPGKPRAAVSDGAGNARPAYAAAHLLAPLERQRDHYGLDDRPAEPAQADWMLGAFLLLRRTMLEAIGGFDEGFRLYCEDIDLCYRAAKSRLGALVRARGRRRACLSGGDGLGVPHHAHRLALAGHRSLRPQAPRASSCALTVAGRRSGEGLYAPVPVRSRTIRLPASDQTGDGGDTCDRDQHDDRHRQAGAVPVGPERGGRLGGDGSGRPHRSGVGLSHLSAGASSPAAPPASAETRRILCLRSGRSTRRIRRFGLAAAAVLVHAAAVLVHGAEKRRLESSADVVRCARVGPQVLRQGGDRLLVAPRRV